MSLYHKPGAGNMILIVRLCHPRHTINAIPMGEFVRTKHACPEPNTLNVKLQDLKKDS